MVRDNRYMGKARIRFAVVVIVGLLVAMSGWWYGGVKAEVGGQGVAVAGSESERVIVKWRRWTPEWVKKVVLRNIEVVKEQKMEMADTLVIRGKIKGSGSTEARMMADELGRSLWVEYAEPDYVAEALEVPNDSLVGSQWGLDKVKAFGAWSATHGSSQVDIAIVDTGIDRGHEDLASKVVKRANFTTDGDDDGNGHGTHVAGIAGAMTNNGKGVAGMAYEGRLFSVKVLDDDGSGYYSWVADGVTWAVDNGAEVINLSLGGSYPSRTLQRAIEDAWNRGVVVVAAAGNNGRSYPVYPAYYSDVIAVGAIDENDTRPSWSTYGSWVDVAAPGVAILSTYNNGGYISLSGTSMASPWVAGLAGLVKGEHLAWSNQQVRQQIESTAEKIPGTGSYWSFGRIDACAAVDCGAVGGGGLPTMTPTATPTVTMTPTLTPVPPTSTPTQTPTPIEPTSTPTPVSPTDTPIPIPPTPTQTPTLTPTPVSPTATPTPGTEPTPTPTLKYWWCAYVPDHWTCR